VYPPFIQAFCAAYEHHKTWLAAHGFEADYCPMFVSENRLAMRYQNYSRRFDKLICRLRKQLFGSEDPEMRIYGQLLYENRLGLHALRHWFSVQLVLHGEDIAQIQYWRGDRSPESALVYLQNKGDLIRELNAGSELLTDILMSEGAVQFDE
jgi:integrase